MGLFDFFKSKNKQEDPKPSTGKTKFTKTNVEDLVLISLNILCDDVSTMSDVNKELKNRGLEDSQISIIADRAKMLYNKHFASTGKRTIPIE